MYHSSMKDIQVSVPASSANLGPAFDCLGLALDLWNEARFEPVGDGLAVEISGEGESELATDEGNLIVKAFQLVYKEAGKASPTGLHIQCRNRIPLGSGLGSSSAAIAMGLSAANALLGKPFSLNGLLNMGAKLEGHADNLAAALFGGLVLAVEVDGRFETVPMEHAPLHCVVVLPEIEHETQAARSRLPEKVALQDAVFNIGRATWLADALRKPDVDALRSTMQDRIHQASRLEHIPGGEEALEAAWESGAAAALSGAGPGLIAIVEAGREKAVTEAMRAPFAQQGIPTRQYLLSSTQKGAHIVED